MSDGEVVAWVSDEGLQPLRMLLMADDGRVRLLSRVDGEATSYVELMPPCGIAEMVQAADMVLSGRGSRLPVTLTLTRLAAAVIKIFMRMRSLECELADLRRDGARGERMLQAAE